MQILTRRLLLVLLISVVPRLQAQTSEDTAKVRKKAMELYEQTKMMEALPLLEKVVAANPTDVVAVERLAFATLVKAIAAKKPDDQQQLRTRAQALAMRARDLGDDSDLLKSLLDALSQADKDVLKFSDRAEVDAAMREGESAFARGDFSKALKAYERALKLDPNQYEAALFSGDVYFKQKQMAKAGEWFERAIKINPDRETAYRYWGDALMADGKLDEARAKFVDAVIAEPYNRLSWAGLSQWANRARARLGHPRVDSPS
jgi:tetratricopeptide (TPR) repeat protein